MAIDVHAEAFIERPREEVATYAMDPANDAIWIGGISQARPLDDGPVREGLRVERVASFLGRRIEYVLEVEHLEPPARIVMRSVRAPFPMRVTYTFDERSGGTVARIRVEGEPGRFYRLAGPMLGPGVRRSLQRDLANLKRILESRASTG